MSNAFSVINMGQYPNEVICAYPVNFFNDNYGNTVQLIDTNQPLPFKNHIQYQKRVNNEIINRLDPNYNNYFVISGNNSVTPVNNNLFNSLSTLTFNDETASIVFNVSSLRQTFKNPREVNLFYIEYGSIQQTIDLNSPNTVFVAPAKFDAQTGSTYDFYTTNKSVNIISYNKGLYCGYLTYPTRLFLNPLALSYNYDNNTWALSANTNIMPLNVVYYNGTQSILDESSNYHIDYLNKLPVIQTLSQYPLSQYSIVYSICASRTRVSLPIPSQGFVSQFNYQLESNSVLSPDSTFVSYSALYINTPAIGNTITQLPTDIYNTNSKGNLFHSNYIIYYDPLINSSSQIFQLAQYTATKYDELGASYNCRLSAVFTLNNSNLYYNIDPNYLIESPSPIFNVSYIADSLRFKTTQETLSSTIKGFSINGNSYGGLNVAIPVTNISDNSKMIVWDTKYPPHYYSYKSKLVTTNTTPTITKGIASVTIGLNEGSGFVDPNTRLPVAPVIGFVGGAGGSGNTTPLTPAQGLALVSATGGISGITITNSGAGYDGTSPVIISYPQGLPSGATTPTINAFNYNTVTTYGISKQYDSFDLNFYLNSYVSYSEDTLIANLSSYIQSDYSALSYNLDYPNYQNTGEYIKYNFINLNTDAIPYLNVYYGYDKTTNKWLSSYDVINSPWVPAVSGKDLQINYFTHQYGALFFAVRPSLSGANGQIDAFNATNIAMAVSYLPLTGSPIFLDVMDEQSNQITVDSSFNINATAWPTRDLRNSIISWSFNPVTAGQDVSNVTINSVDSNGNYIQKIIPNQGYNFDETTWTVVVSGYGPVQTSVNLNSVKYNENASILTNKNLFDYFSNGVFSITQDPNNKLNNLNKIRTVGLNLKIPFGKSQYNIVPPSTPIYWQWSYNGVNDSKNQYISAYYYYNDNPYEYGNNTNAFSGSSIYFKITPDSGLYPKLNNVTVSAFSNIVYPPVVGVYSFEVDNFPDSSLFNADFYTYYTLNNSKNISSTRDGINTITRANIPYDINTINLKDLNFSFLANSDMPQFVGQNKYWKVINNNNVHITPYVKDTSLVFDFYPTLTQNNSISLVIENALVNTWLSAHNISAKTDLYLVDPVEFNKPLNFIMFPKYAWLGDKNLTILNENNYTLSLMPSAYGNTRSNSINFYVSANKNIFTKYIYQNNISSYVSIVTSTSGLIDFSYDPNTAFNYRYGIPVTLYAYNNTTYPQINGTSYLSLDQNNNLISKNFNNISNTTPLSTFALNSFSHSPLIIPYNDLVLKYDILNFSNNSNEIDLDTTKTITISQIISTTPANTPALAVSGTITYYLSTAFWTVSTSVPSKDGVYNLFDINVGDPFVPLFMGNLGIENLYIYAKPNVTQQIPTTTFNKYLNTKQYPINADLWNPVNL